MGAGSDGLRIAFLGTRGVPARYGGFETAVEEVGSRLAARGHDVLVYCRTGGDAGPAEHLGMRLVHLPALRRKSLETLSHTALSVGHLLAAGRPDVAMVFNAANSPFLPALRALRVPVALHVDGLEWRRAKWAGAGRAYYLLAECLGVRWADALIADAEGIAEYYRAEFAAESNQIAYGAPIVAPGADRLAEVGLLPGRYHLAVARFEPENHLHLVVEGYVRSRARLPLVVVGTAPYSDGYTATVHALADDRVRFLGGLWDQELLDQLYAGCATYLHGHSVGGTNPSLLRAIGAGAPCLAYDVPFNRDVLAEAGEYFVTVADVARALDAAETDPYATARRGIRSLERARRYDWEEVADAYEALATRLAVGGPVRVRPTGHRAGVAASWGVPRPQPVPVPPAPVAPPELVPAVLEPHVLAPATASRLRAPFPRAS